MATKAAKPEQIDIPQMYDEPKRRNLTWLWVGAGLALLVFFAILTLHFAGVLRTPEKALYEKTKNVPVLNFFTGAFGQSDFEKQLTPEQLVVGKDLVRKLERRDEEVSKLNRTIADLTTMNVELVSKQDELSKSMKNVDKVLKSMQEGGGAGATAPSGSLTAAAPTALPATAASGATNLAALAGQASRGGGGDNYRLVSKIFEKLPADTAVDIMNNLTDDEKIKILSLMKDKNIADILSALEPAKSAELARRLARPKS
jgi:hypothetical protein